MKNDSISNNAMARVYRTAAAVSALILSSSFAYAADPPVGRGNVSVNINPTTGYYVTNNTTLRLPDGVRTTPSAGASTVTKYSGGLKQSIPTGITIDAIKKSAPLPVAVRAGNQSLKRAATGCLTSARCNVALLLASAGLDQLFDGLDWIMGDGGKITKTGGFVGDLVPSDYQIIYAHNGTFSNIYSRCQVNGFTTLECRHIGEGWYRGYMCPPKRNSLNLVGWKLSDNPNSSLTDCYYGGGSTPSNRKTVPVTDTEIATGVESNYNPEPSDWQALMPELQPDDIEITWAPTLQGEPITTTHYDADGNPHKVTETNIWYDFDVRDNPSPQPKLDLKKREETKTYEEGVLTGTTTTESTDSASSDDTPPPPPESLIDCDLFPTACAWFDWTQEEPIEPDDDLSGLLQEVPIDSKTFTITGGAAVCPAPLVLDLSVFGSREVSYQPLCDLASTMKYLYLALMSFAAAVLLNRSVNRV